jgi:hypothetical protein
MKVTKVSTQPKFQPIELKITIESQEERHNFLVLSSLSSNIRTVLSSCCLDPDVAKILKSFLDDIAECL